MRRDALAALAATALAGGLAAPASAAVTDVEVGDKYFRSNNITITVGDTVRWNWVDGGHNVKSTSGPEAFELPFHDDGESDQRTFTKAGTYTYVCRPHDDDMRGTIRVVEATPPPPPPADEETPPADDEETPPPADDDTTPPADDDTTPPADDDDDTTPPVDDDDVETPPADDEDTPPAAEDPAPTGEATPRTETAPSADPGPPASADAAPEVPADATESFGVPSLGEIDAAAPAVTALRVTNGSLRFRASERGTLVVRAVQVGARRHRVIVRRFTLRRGANVLYLRDWFAGRRYRLSLQAIDARGNAAKPVRLRVTLRR